MFYILIFYFNLFYYNSSFVEVRIDNKIMQFTDEIRHECTDVIGFFEFDGTITKIGSEDISDG